MFRKEFQIISRIAVGAGDVGEDGVCGEEGEPEENLFENEKGRHFRVKREGGECD